MIFNKAIGDYDFVLQSKNRNSFILFNFLELDRVHHSSVNYLVSIKDDKFSGEINVWIDTDVLKNFIRDLIEANINRTGNFNLYSLSPEEMEIKFMSQRVGRFEIAYSIKRIGYTENLFIETTLKGSLEFDIEFFYPLEEKLKEINKLLK
ncbi:hypothetical protein [Paenibacillus harenae]|uniref:hypothetical protein n=1 Tax=Paenibacillus harenae TaxID=306543 RepID=UPI0027916166|nr:hypothetical protein [Paenibacillus harenae]MDQ0060020.1 hypothetical protein [Paenibacillus harenae]